MWNKQEAGLSVRLRTEVKGVLAQAEAVLYHYSGGHAMKRNASRNSSISQPSIAWRADEYAALQVRVAQRYEDRVSEDIFDAEDERVEVDTLFRRRAYEAN